MKKEQLLYYSLKYQGDYFKIKKAIFNQESWSKLKYSGNYLSIFDKNYPLALKRLKQAPYIIYYYGDLDLLQKPLISIVGSSVPTYYGLKMTDIIVRQVTTKQIVVSGLRKGIETRVQLSALKSGQSIVVLAGGINYIYPKDNYDLYQSLKKQHLILSEFPGFLKPTRRTFQAQARLIAALGETLIVTQADKYSSCFFSVDQALELGKTVYSIPYQLDDKSGSGCNYLLELGALYFKIENDLI